MNKYERALQWLNRAKSNVTIARLNSNKDLIFYEDLCFEAEQAVEKALKALCILFDIKFPRTHNIQHLVELIENINFKFPEELLAIKELTEYSVETRYPGEYESVSEEEYNRAINLSTKFVEFADSHITNMIKFPFKK
ncbi:MAG: HEPN domain-containing protein [Ignavibacteriales bacterium]|nr:HEPN domain-containing protein [Ignavibacteriales bacterium]